MRLFPRFLLLLPAISSATHITPAPSLPLEATSSQLLPSPSSDAPLILDFYEKNDPRLELRQVAPGAPAPAVPPAAPGAAVPPAQGGAGNRPAAGGGAPPAGAPAPVVPGAAGAAPPVPVPGAANPAPVPIPPAPAVGVGGAGAVPPAAQPGVSPAQVPSITVFMLETIVGGAKQQVPVTYTQRFSDTPSQGPTPSQGKIGLGTISGSVGAVNTKEAKNGAASFTASRFDVSLWIMGLVSILVTAGGSMAL